MYLMCLKLVHGWKYEEILFKRMGLTLNDVQKQELERRIANSKKQKQYKDESATKKRRKILRVGRLQQNVNYNKDYKNPKDVRKHKSNIIII